MGKQCGATTRSGKRRTNREGTVKGDPVLYLELVSCLPLFFSSLFSFCRVISEGILVIGLLSLRPDFPFRFSFTLVLLNTTCGSCNILSQVRARVPN